MYNNKDYLISELGEKEGITDNYESSMQYSLSIWYSKIQKKRLSELTDGDLARFIRQKMFLKYVVPEILERIWKNPAAGELYYGEVLEALSKLNDDFLRSNHKISQEIYKFLIEVNNNKLISNDFEWTYEGEEQEFKNLVIKFIEKIDRINSNL
jgi:hypothetical protein